VHRIPIPNTHRGNARLVQAFDDSRAKGSAALVRVLHRSIPPPRHHATSTNDSILIYIPIDQRHQVAFMTAGYPTRADTVPLLLALQAGGADVVELGVPFTDPQADGTTIQKASEVRSKGVCWLV